MKEIMSVAVVVSCKRQPLGVLDWECSSIPITTEQELEYLTQKVSRYSAPTDLKITDLRIAYWRNTPVIKIYTNQDIYGLGEVRDAGSPTYAFFLKSRLLGKNPCSVERIFKNIKQFGGHGTGRRRRFRG